VNLGLTAIEQGMVLTALIGLVPIVDSVPGIDRLTNYTAGIVRPPLGSRGRLKLSLGLGGAACAITVSGTGVYGPQSEVVHFSSGGGDVYTIKTYSLLGSLSSDVAPGDILSVSMEIPGLQRATTGVADLSVAASDAAPGQSVLHIIDNTADVRVDPAFVPILNAELVADVVGLARAKMMGDTGAVLGKIIRAQVTVVGSRAYVPIRLT
jgi:hypothetical protein